MSHRFFTLPAEFIQAQQKVYTPCNLLCSNINFEEESQEYGAFQMNINNKTALFRTAKITPTKIGQFVTFWKRIPSGIIAPFDLTDGIDFFIISVRAGDNFGQFIFPKVALLKQGIISQHGLGGKRAMRMYPPWDQADNKQAIKTQQWQKEYFLPITSDEIDCKKVVKLFA